MPIYCNESFLNPMMIDNDCKSYIAWRGSDRGEPLIPDRQTPTRDTETYLHFLETNTELRCTSKLELPSGNWKRGSRWLPYYYTPVFDGCVTKVLYSSQCFTLTFFHWCHFFHEAQWTLFTNITNFTRCTSFTIFTCSTYSDSYICWYSFTCF